MTKEGTESRSRWFHSRGYGVTGFPRGRLDQFDRHKNFPFETHRGREALKKIARSQVSGLFARRTRSVWGEQI